MPALDWSAFMPVLVIVLLAGCGALLLSMLDRENVPLHEVRRRIWCPRHKRIAMVEFNERVQTGMAFRTVRHCPLRRQGEQCGEGCVWESGSVPTP
jgi:hypothetical protein